MTIKKLFAFVFLLFLGFPCFANQHSYSARDLALAGAFIALVNDSTSLLVNPAGIAPNPYNGQSIHEVTMSSGRAHFDGNSVTDRPSDQFNLLYAYTGQQFGLGIGFHDNDNLYFESTLGLPSTNIATEEYIATISYLAFNWLKVGASIRSLSAETQGLSDYESDSSKPNYKVGFQTSPWEYNSAGYLIALRLAATHQSEGKTKPFNTSTNANKDLIVPLIPKSTAAGISIDFLSASDITKVSHSVALSLETERRQYSPEVYGLFPQAPQSSNGYGDLKLDRKAASLEMMRNNEDRSYALRLGVAEIQHEDSSTWKQRHAGIGLGVIFSHWVFDVGFRRSSTSVNKNTNIKENNVLGSISYQF